MPTSDVIALAALVVSLISFALTLIEQNRAQQEAIIKALQGEKEAVAYIAFRIRKLRLATRKDRKDIATALTLAWIYENSNRSRATLLSALKQCNKDDVRTVWKEIKILFDDYKRDVLIPYNKTKELDDHYISLEQLKTSMGL